jgi:alkanesulfonate monooxygenase SsuD/methylene tetrahydromethanopterin reductase-like flavin-dependent oxidoreductase (luciferase family)
MLSAWSQGIEIAHSGHREACKSAVEEDRTMGRRIGLAINPSAGWKATEIASAAREAEEAGFEAIFSTEIRTEGLSAALFMGTCTESIKVGTFVANIYLRHSFACAQAAAFISEVTSGRLILGLGVSHPVVNVGRHGIEMGQPLAVLRSYIEDVRRCFRKEGPAFSAPSTAPPVDVPIYVAALTSKALEQAGEIADGIMPVFWPASRVRKSQTWIERGQAKASGRPKLDLTLGLPTFVGDNLAEARGMARRGMSTYAAVPTYQRLFRTCGFEEEASAAERGATFEAISDRLLDAFCLVGSAERCRERLEPFREAGVDLPILYCPLDFGEARKLIQAFRQ